MQHLTNHLHSSSMYLYTDASIKFSQDENFASYGGYITNDNGVILFCFFDKVNPCDYENINDLEALAIQKGLEFVHELGCSHLIIQTDSKSTVESFHKMIFTPNYRKEQKTQFQHRVKKIIEDLQFIVQTFEIYHVPRTQNHFADLLSDYSFKKHTYSKKSFIDYTKGLTQKLFPDTPFDFTEHLIYPRKIKS